MPSELESTLVVLTVWLQIEMAASAASGCLLDLRPPSATAAQPDVRLTDACGHEWLGCCCPDRPQLSTGAVDSQSDGAKCS